MKRFLALLLSSFLVVITAGYGLSVRAQSPSPAAERFTPTPIAIAFNPATDGETYRPPDREQSDLPFSDDSRAIIGRDQRVPVLNRSFPWSAIGRIDWSVDGKELGHCTGTLISPDVVLTNSHCLAPEEANYQPIIPRGTEQNGRIQILFTSSREANLQPDSGMRSKSGYRTSEERS
ncbi:trypsin-like serine protease [Leptolyngbya sp. 7M]|uniref:trypsin-like serine protease n=1 Tax=Leptolyngbya sp. 7M TaxID=2812896 RepID=UPI001B8CD78F|nr:trypsin-like serine protease [Leptolyngbya sp. 7M]QYO64376.1 trypsin-like serine protease [Leptolyngbya sp. 7M]